MRGAIIFCPFRARVVGKMLVIRKITDSLIKNSPAPLTNALPVCIFAAFLTQRKIPALFS
jgi:hypothetical protein